MEIEINNMCDWERKKAVYLMGIVEELGIDLSAFGEVAVNQNSGYVYIWSEEYNFSLYMPIDCNLQRSDIYALWTDSNGEEEETSINGMSLQDIETWVNEQEVKK